MFIVVIQLIVKIHYHQHIDNRSSESFLEARAAIKPHLLSFLLCTARQHIAFFKLGLEVRECNAALQALFHGVHVLFEFLERGYLQVLGDAHATTVHPEQHATFERTVLNSAAQDLHHLLGCSFLRTAFITASDFKDLSYSSFTVCF